MQALLTGLAGACLAVARVRDEGAPPTAASGGGGVGGEPYFGSAGGRGGSDSSGSGGGSDSSGSAGGAGGEAPKTGELVSILRPLGCPLSHRSAALCFTPLYQLGTLGQPAPGFLLLLAKLCLFLEGTTVPAVMDDLALHFPNTSSGPDAPPPFVPGEAARRLGAAAQALLGAYVEAHGRALGVAAARSTAATNWLAASEPRWALFQCMRCFQRIHSAEPAAFCLAAATITDR